MIIKYHLEHDFDTDVWYCMRTRGHKWHMPTDLLYDSDGKLIFHRVCKSCGFTQMAKRKKEEGCCGGHKKNVTLKWEDDVEAIEWVLRKKGQII